MPQFLLTSKIPHSLDNATKPCYNGNNQTVDAEIKVIMPPQRARGAGNRVKHRSSNGPRRVQSKALAEYSATYGHTSVVGDMMVSRKVHGTAVNQGGTANRLYSSLTDPLLSRRFYFHGGCYGTSDQAMAALILSSSRTF